MQAESGSGADDRVALFPGKSCFPLSADNPTQCELDSTRLGSGSLRSCSQTLPSFRFVLADPSQFSFAMPRLV
jgi:hypothetical protein